METETEMGCRIPLRILYSLLNFYSLELILPKHSLRLLEISRYFKIGCAHSAPFDLGHFYGDVALGGKHERTQRHTLHSFKINRLVTAPRFVLRHALQINILDFGR